MPPSPTENAPKSIEELKELLKNDTKVKVAGESFILNGEDRRILIRPGVDIDGVLRGKIMSKDKFLSAAKSDGFGFCSVIFGWDSEPNPSEH